MELAGIALGWGIMAFFAGLTVLEAARYFRTALDPALEDAPPCPEDGASPGRLRAAGGLIALWALSRLLILAVLAACQAVNVGSFVTFGNNLAWFARRWDAKHYLALIEEGYRAEGDTRLLIVFLPLYPAVCRAVCTATEPQPSASSSRVRPGSSSALMPIVSAQM